MKRSIDKDLMIDIETLGTSPNAVILSAVVMDFNKNVLCHINFPIEEQIAKGRVIDQNTWNWWSTQKINPITSPTYNTVSLCLDNLIKSIKNFTFEDIWSKSPLFDINILQNIMDQYGYEYPWRYTQLMDVRTISNLHSKLGEGAKDPHNPISDCEYQVDLVTSFMTNYTDEITVNK